MRCRARAIIDDRHSEFREDITVAPHAGGRARDRYRIAADHRAMGLRHRGDQRLDPFRFVARPGQVQFDFMVNPGGCQRRSNSVSEIKWILSRDRADIEVEMT